MAARTQRKIGNMLGLVPATSKGPTSDIGHVVMISGLYWQGCNADEWCECEMIKHNPRCAFGRCKQPSTKVFRPVGQGGMWIKYPEYLKYRAVRAQDRGGSRA